VLREHRVIQIMEEKKCKIPSTKLGIMLLTLNERTSAESPSLQMLHRQTHSIYIKLLHSSVTERAQESKLATAFKSTSKTLTGFGLNAFNSASGRGEWSARRQVALCHQKLCLVEASWNVMAHAQKPDFVFHRNGGVYLNRPGGVSSVDYWQPRCAHQR